MKCWTTVCDAGPTLKQPCVKVGCLHGKVFVLGSHPRATDSTFSYHNQVITASTILANQGEILISGPGSLQTGSVRSRRRFRVGPTSKDVGPTLNRRLEQTVCHFDLIQILMPHLPVVTRVLDSAFARGYLSLWVRLAPHLSELQAGRGKFNFSHSARANLIRNLSRLLGMSGLSEEIPLSGRSLRLLRWIKDILGWIATWPGGWGTFLITTNNRV